MDIFCEYIIKRKKTVTDTIIQMGCVFGATFLSFLAIMFSPYLMGLELIAIAGIWYGAVYLIRKQNIEYEYILTNSVLDIDKIMAKRSRKRVVSINLAHIDSFMPADAKRENPSAKVLDLTGDIGGKGVYCTSFSKEDGRYVVYLQPNARILNGIKAVNPRLVTVREEDLQ